MKTHIILQSPRQRYRAFVNLAAPFERWLGHRIPLVHRAVISSILRQRNPDSGIRALVTESHGKISQPSLSDTLVAFLGYWSSRHPAHAPVIADTLKPLAEARAITLGRMLRRRSGVAPPRILATAPTCPYSVRGSTFNHVLVLNAHGLLHPGRGLRRRRLRWSDLMTSLLGPPHGPSSMIIVHTAKPPPRASPLVRQNLGPAFVDADTEP